MTKETITVALAGNPNSGKTTLFNELTGAHHHVGNYPGVTVEKKEGERTYQGRRLVLVDLPGTYSLSAYSLEEIVARNFILEDRPNVVVDVVDASNLERNLYLASMFVELDVPVVLALNMMDVAASQGKHINTELLSELFGLQVVPVVARKGEGLEALLDTVLLAADQGRPRRVHINFGHELEGHLAELAEAIAQAGLMPHLPPRWLAIKLLENDAQIRERMLAEEPQTAPPVLALADEARAHIEAVVGDDAEVALADRRYGFVSGACREAVTTTQLHRVDWSQRVDAVMTNRLLGLPIFFALMWLMFEVVFGLGNPLMELLDTAFGWLNTAAREALPPGELQSLVADGIIGGVGGVLVFLPNILLLFLVISILEDSGYMSRAAFVIDRVMHQVGLHGKSFIAMLIGFGCSVPAVLATRTLESTRDRIVTILVVPLMSCGARLPVYILLAGAFFPPHQAGKLIFAIYLLGVALALLMARLFSRYLLPGPPTPFVMELPPYRMPTLRGTMVHMWERGWLYVKKAGTTILAMSIVMWYLLSHPILPPDPSLSSAEQGAAQIRHSYGGRLAQAAEPLMKPLGFDYRITASLFAGLAAKEIIISTMGTIYSLGEADEESRELRQALRNDPTFSPLVAFVLMVFVLIYIPCVATVAAIYRETNSWRWATFAVVYTCTLAWVVSLVIYQGGRALGLG
jgi:ferrous iron transport protein B